VVVSGFVGGFEAVCDLVRYSFPMLFLVLTVSRYMTAPETCGQIMLSLATDRYPAKGVVAEGDGDVAFGSARERGGGCYSVGRFGDESGGVSWEGLRREGLGEEVWAHTMGVIEGAVAKGRAV